MRRHAIRLVFAILATSSLVACADLPTGPKSPAGPRANTTLPGSSTTDTTKRTGHQGTNI